MTLHILKKKNYLFLISNNPFPNKLSHFSFSHKHGHKSQVSYATSLKFKPIYLFLRPATKTFAIIVKNPKTIGTKTFQRA